MGVKTLTVGSFVVLPSESSPSSDVSETVVEKIAPAAIAELLRPPLSNADWSIV